MAANWTIKQGDTEPVLSDTLKLSDGSIPPLAGATLQFVMRSLAPPAPVALTGTAQITNPNTGEVSFTPSAQDTAQAGLFEASWVLTFAGGGRMTFPTVGYLSVSIEQSLTSTGAQQLVGLPDLKDYLNINADDHAHDAKLTRFIAGVTPLIENIVGPVIPRTFDEWHEGGQYWIQLRRRPSYAMGTDPLFTIQGCDEYRGPIKYTLQQITDPTAASIYSVMLDPRIGTLYRRTTGGGVIPFGAGPWGGGMPQAVHVVYTAGQQTVPANVYEAALEAVRVNYRQTQDVGRGNLTLADTTDTGAPLGFFLPRRCLELLAPMRRHPSVA